MKETPLTKSPGGVRPPGLRNDFSDQEESMTASAMPPQFALTANAAAAPAGDGEPHQISEDYLPTAWKSVGLNPEDYAHLDPVLANKIIAISVKFLDEHWIALWRVICAHSLESLLPAIYEDFYVKLDWVLDRDVESLAVLADAPYKTVAGEKVGHVELVRTAERVGMRAIVPFEGFGGNLILDPRETNTVLGRCVESVTREEFAEQMNVPRGTNYFRYQPEFMVGKNKGGGNVLDVADRTWSWPLNNAWLQAAVDRGDRLRFVSDPAEPASLYKKGGSLKHGLTVTGMELGVLMNRGYAPHEGSGNVQQGYMPADAELGMEWEEIGREVKTSGKFDELDPAAYKEFMGASRAPARHPKAFKAPSGDILAVQTNFFGGQPSAKTAQ